MALQLPYVPVFTKIGTTAHDGQLRLPKTQRGLCRESERKRGGKSFIASDKCTDVLLQLPQHSQERVSECWRREDLGKGRILMLDIHLSLTLTFLGQCLDLSAFVFIQLCWKTLLCYSKCDIYYSITPHSFLLFFTFTIFAIVVIRDSLIFKYYLILTRQCLFLWPITDKWQTLYFFKLFCQN